MISDREKMDRIVQVLNAQISAQGVPSNAFVVDPVQFSGNFDAGGRRNNPQYGFTVTTMDDEHAATVRGVFSKLGRSGALRPADLTSSRSAIASAIMDNTRTFGHVADNIDSVNAALNKYVLDDEHTLPTRKPAAHL